MLPALGWMMSAITRNNVDLPQPDGPNSVRKPPASRVNERFSNAVTARRSLMKRTVTLRQSNAAAAAMRG